MVRCRRIQFLSICNNNALDTMHHYFRFVLVVFGGKGAHQLENNGKALDLSIDSFITDGRND